MTRKIRKQQTEKNPQAKRLSADEAWKIVLKKRKWIGSLAKGCAWGGAEFDDVVQTALIIGFLLLIQCRDAAHARYYMEKLLPLRIVDAAQKMRWDKRVVSLEDMARLSDPEGGEEEAEDTEAVLARCGFCSRADLEAVRATDRKALRERLHAVLTPAQRAVVDLLMDGYQCCEVQAMMGLGRQALESRLKKIGKKIRPILDEFLRD